MSFWIQTGNPVYVVPSKEVMEEDYEEGVEELSSAIQLVFPMITESALLWWNGIYIPFEYKYDLSVMIDDILPMLTELQEKDQGKCDIGFGSDSFRAVWEMEWINETLSINAKWYSVGCDLDLINSVCNELTIDRNTFICEWKGILTHVIEAIKKANIKMIRHEITHRDEFDDLLKINAAIPNFGYLYQNISS